MNTPTLTTLKCLVQNRLGALDRVIAAFTHRGIIPQQIVSVRDELANTVQIHVDFTCDDHKVLEKLVKFLEKQVYVLEAGMLCEGMSREKISKITELFTSVEKRRASHVHNA